MKYQNSQQELRSMQITLNWSRRLYDAEMRKMMNEKNRQCLMSMKHARVVSSIYRCQQQRNTTVHQNVHLCEQIRRRFLLGYFSKIYDTELPHRAKTVYMYLKDRSNAQGQCYPAIDTITKELHLSHRTERAIQDLITAGFLKKEQRWRENGGRSSLLYTITDSS